MVAPAPARLQRVLAGWNAARTQREAIGLTLATIAWAIVVTMLMPRRITVRGDDFGYLESAVSTIQSGTWSSSQWLEPFNIILPMLTAGVQALTGDFWIATMGVIFILAIGNFVLLHVWLRLGSIATLAVVLVPVSLNKAIEFTGVPLGLAMTLVALLAWRHKRYALFFVAVALGCANRQNAICLLGFPAWELVQIWIKTRRFEFRLLWSIGAIVLFVLALQMWLPTTFARELSADALRTQFSIGAFVATAALCGVFLLTANAVWGLLRGDSLCAIFIENIKAPSVPLLITIIGAIVSSSGGVGLLYETPGLAKWGPIFVVIAISLGAWGGRWRLIRGDSFLVATLYILLISVRGRCWDYYLIEPALVIAWCRNRSEERKGWAWRYAMLAAGIVGAAFLFRYLRREEAKLVAYEVALRRGDMSVVEASDAPFGLLGWKLFGYARAQKSGHPELIDFMRYVEGGRSYWTGADLVIDRAGGRRSIHPSGMKWTLPPDYRERQFPLTAGEWRALLQRKESQ